MKRVWIIGFTLLVACLVAVLAGCGARPLESVDVSLLGEWHGVGTVRSPISFTPSQDEAAQPQSEEIELHITMNSDSTVTGSVGGAELRDCVLMGNRNELGRKLNVATDYIVMHGTLDGPIIDGDESMEKDFTIPFDIFQDDAGEDRLKGTVMWLEDGKYPSPLVRVDLGQ